MYTMKNYCVKKYSVEQLDEGQKILSNLIRDKKRARITLNHYIERVDECEKMLKLNEEMKGSLNASAYLRNKESYESDMYDFKKIAIRIIGDIENMEKKIEDVREKYCL